MNDEALSAILDVMRHSADLKPRIPWERITAGTRFRAELGYDSLAMISLFTELQERYPSLDEARVAEWQTLGDCADDIRKSLVP